MSLALAVVSFALASGPQQPLRPRGEVLYSRATDGTWQIWSRDLDRGTDQQVTTSLGDKRYPAWTSDGRVCFQSVNQECWIVERGADGSEKATAVLRELWPVRDVIWAPDGKRLAFSRIRTDAIDAANVCVANLDGSSPRWLTQEPGIQYTPCWSPDGKRLAYVSGNGWGSYDICVVSSDGADRKQIAVPGTHEFLPAWSPDGQSLAYSSDRSGDFEIWAGAVDGSSARQLTDRRGLDTRPAWSPDGAFIAYTRASEGVVQVWCMRADGSEPRVLIEAPQGARDVAWRARPAVETAAPAEPLELTEVALDRKTIDVQKGETTTVRLRVSRAASVRVDIVDESGVTVRRLGGERVDGGSHTFAWDGRDLAGEPVVAGVYRYVIAAEDEGRREVVLDASTEPWGEEIKPLEFAFDKQTGDLSWLMPQAGFARLRIAMRDFPLLATLLDWEPLEAGRQKLAWNGVDASGLVQLREHPNLWVTLELYALPANTVIVHGRKNGERRSASHDYAPLIATAPTAFREARKARVDALAPEIDFDFPTTTELDDRGRPIVQGVVPVRISIAPKDLASMTDALFEAALYVDLSFFFEEEESTSPLTYMWDTRTLQPGPHLLTVNVFSYDGRIGALTRSVVIGGAR